MYLCEQKIAESPLCGITLMPASCGNPAQLRQFKVERLNASGVQCFRASTLQCLNAPWLEARGAQGFRCSTLQELKASGAERFRSSTLEGINPSGCQRSRGSTAPWPTPCWSSASGSARFGLALAPSAPLDSPGLWPAHVTSPQLTPAHSPHLTSTPLHATPPDCISPIPGMTATKKPPRREVGRKEAPGGAQASGARRLEGVS